MKAEAAYELMFESQTKKILVERYGWTYPRAHQYYKAKKRYFKSAGPNMEYVSGAECEAIFARLAKKFTPQELYEAYQAVIDLEGELAAASQLRVVK